MSIPREGRLTIVITYRLLSLRIVAEALKPRLARDPRRLLLFLIRSPYTASPVEAIVGPVVPGRQCSARSSRSSVWVIISADLSSTRRKAFGWQRVDGLVVTRLALGTRADISVLYVIAEVLETKERAEGKRPSIEEVDGQRS